ncbi:MAG: efflux RND transporter periplasmic adaptor subunit [Chthoniobacteraceae bacterium]
MKIFGKLSFWFILVLLAAGFGGYKYWQARNADTVSFDTIPVGRADIVQAVTATGTLNPVINVTVGSQVSGNILSLYVDYNSPVKKGMLLAEIDPRNFNAAVEQAQGNLANAQAVLELAQVTATRDDSLRKQNAIPQSTLDSAIADLHKAQASVKINSGTLAQAQNNLAFCKIYSPVDGIVISRSVDVGQTVQASMTAPTLFTIANDLANMQIDSNVAEADVGNVKEGQDVDFTVDAFPYDTFHGKVIQVRNAATTTNNVVTYDVVIGVNNAELKLRPGMTANVSIIVEQRKSTLALGNAALRVKMPEGILPAPSATPTPAASPGGDATAQHSETGGGQKGQWAGRRGGGHRNSAAVQHVKTVYVLPAGAQTPETRQVHVGITDGINTEITSGLDEGEQVVTNVNTGSDASASSSATTNPFMPKMPGRGGGGGGRR